MASIDMNAIVRAAGSEFADNLRNEVRGAHEVEFCTEDDFVKEQANWTDPEELVNFVDTEPEMGPILNKHW